MFKFIPSAEKFPEKAPIFIAIFTLKYRFFVNQNI